MTHSPLQHHGTKNKKILFFSLGTSFFLFASKIVLGLFSGSAALMASAIDSMMDSLSTLLNIFVLHHAMEPADKEHPFGHGKFEAFSGLVQGSLIIFLSIWLLVYSVVDFGTPLHKNFEIWGIGVVIISIIAPLALSAVMKKRAKQSKSLVMESEHSHFFADGIMNAGVLLALVLSYFFSVAWVDSIIGIGIALWLMWGAKNLLSESFNVLVDKQLPEDIQQEIQKILKDSSEILGWHNLRTRRSGMEYHLDIHFEFPKNISLKDAHDKSHMVENRITKKFPNAIILTHFDYENDM